MGDLTIIADINTELSDIDVNSSTSTADSLILGNREVAEVK